jgi:hypothetical protein
MRSINYFIHLLELQRAAGPVDNGGLHANTLMAGIANAFSSIATVTRLHLQL